MIKFLENISKSSISFSFIYSGSSNLQSGSNISSGFGFLAVHYLMKFIAQITNGFYAVVDENLDYSVIHSKNLLHYYNMLLPISRVPPQPIFNTNSSLNDSTNLSSHSENNSSRIMSPEKDCECDTTDNEENRDSFCQNSKACMRNYEKISMHTQSKFANVSKIFRQRSANNILSVKKEVSNNDQVKSLLQSNYDEKSEYKCVQKYELTHKTLTLHQIARIRGQEGLVTLFGLTLLATFWLHTSNMIRFVIFKI